MAKPDKKPVGRPSKYREDYDALLIDFMAEGMSFEAFGGHIGVTRPTLYTWLDKHPGFKAAYDLGQTKCQEWWENLGKQMARGVSEERVLVKELHRETPDGVVTEQVYGPASPNASVWIFNMKNRFGWRDKTELSGDPDRPVVLADMATLQPSGKGV